MGQSALPTHLYHIRCDRYALYLAQRGPKSAFEERLKVYDVDAEGYARRDGSPTLRVDMERNIVVFSEGGTLPLSDPQESCGMYTTSRETAYAFFRGLATGFRDGFHAAHSEIMNRMAGMAPHSMPEGLAPDGR